MSYFSSKPNLSIIENPLEKKHFKEYYNNSKLINYCQTQCRIPIKGVIKHSLPDKSNKKTQEKGKILNKDQASTQKKVAFLRKIPIFSNFNSLDLQTIALALQKVSYSKDQYVYKQDDPVKFVYFVKSGDFQVSRYTILKTLQLVPQASGILHKLSQSKNVIKRKDLVLSIKSQYELIGHDEAIQGLKKREFNVYCTSRIGKLFVLPYNEFLSYISSPESSIIIQNKKDYFSLRKLELLKSEKVIDNIFTSKHSNKAICKDKETDIKKKLKSFSVNISQNCNFNELSKRIQNSTDTSKKLKGKSFLSPTNFGSKIVSEDSSPIVLRRSLKSSQKILVPEVLASFREKRKPAAINHHRHLSQ